MQDILKGFANIADVDQFPLNGKFKNAKQIGQIF